MEYKQTLSEFVQMYVYWAHFSHKRTCISIGVYVERPEDNLRCQASPSTSLESLLFTAVHTGGYTPLRAKDPCVSKYKSTGYRDVSTHPSLYQSGGSEFRSPQLHNYFTRELLLQALGEHILSLGIRVGSRNHFAGLFCLIFITHLCQVSIREKDIWSRNEKNVSHPSPSRL